MNFVLRTGFILLHMLWYIAFPFLFFPRHLFLAVLGFELRASNLQGRYSTTRTTLCVHVLQLPD
jgi:hypothetical protein